MKRSQKTSKIRLVLLLVFVFLLTPVNAENYENTEQAVHTWQICSGSKTDTGQSYATVKATVHLQRNLTTGIDYWDWSLSFVPKVGYSQYTGYKRSISRTGTYNFNVVYRIINGSGTIVADRSIANINATIDGCKTIQVPIGIEPYSILKELYKFDK